MNGTPSHGAPTSTDPPAAELVFRCPLPSGLHARPASHLAEAAEAFACAIELCGASGRRANAKSVIALIALDVRHEEECRLSFAGGDAAEAHAALLRFVTDVLPGCDATVDGPVSEGEVVLPRVLAEAGVRTVRGTPASGGIGRGVVVLARARAQPDAAFLDAGGPPEAERERARRALDGLREELTAALAAGPPSTTAGILRAHLSLARDVSLEAAVRRHLDAGEAAPRAVWLAGHELAAVLSRSDSALVRERAIDIEDVCVQLVERMGAPPAAEERLELDAPSVLVADRMAPRQLLALDRGHLRGLVLADAGATSHAVILARSFGIPTLTGVTDARSELAAGAHVVVDAEVGIAVRDDDPRVRGYYDRRILAHERRRAALSGFARPPAVTRDGRRLEVAANVASVEELERAFASGAEGIGLLRTEMHFLGRAEPPREDEQLAFLSRVLEAAAGRPVIVRTLDIGGDKALPYLNLPAEPNPFLGRRGVRLYPELQALIDTQLRAVLRASAQGPLQLIVPMVSTAAEVEGVRRRVDALRAELKGQGIPCGDSLRIGIMLEVPAAAFDLERLATQAELFSLGTNDLAQYFFAADRENERVAGLHDPLQPSFLRFLRSIVTELRARERWVGVCGEMARDPLALPLLVGLGLDEISMAAPALPAVKRRIAGLDSAECAELLARACACADAAEVRTLLKAFRGRGFAQPLLTQDLIVLDSPARTRAEAIAELSDLLFVHFRSDDPLALERAVWDREATYSTGLGGGFAVPHCKSAAVTATTLAVLRLADPVDWDALDGEPVCCAMLLALSASDDERAHMRTLSTLARRLVDDDFRGRILAAPDAAALLACLSRELGPSSQPD